MNQSVTLYERVGGEAAIHQLIGRFYERVLNDPELRHFFENTAIEKLVGMQREFFSAALDGPVCYSGLELSWAHSGRGIERRHFTRYVQHLTDTLKELNLQPEDIEEVVRRISLYADDVVGGGGVDG